MFKMEIKVSMRSAVASILGSLSSLLKPQPDPVVVDSEKNPIAMALANLVVDDADENGSSFGARYDLC